MDQARKKNSHNLPHIERYMRLWEQGVINEPLLILIGGYAGTGKSTLARQLAGVFTHSEVLCTPLIRSVLRSTPAHKNDAYLEHHTYNLDLVDKNIDIVSAYLKQVEPIADAIHSFLNFCASEKQMWIIEGNHVLPGLYKEPSKAILIEAYLKLDDVTVHRKMMGGPTHNRSLTGAEFSNGRQIHNYIVSAVQAHEKQLYEYDEAFRRLLRHIDETLAKYLHGQNL